jgi:hypothetical protein
VTQAPVRVPVLAARPVAALTRAVLAVVLPAVVLLAAVQPVAALQPRLLAAKLLPRAVPAVT